jgi:Domain of unknown function (DUF4932)
MKHFASLICILIFSLAAAAQNDLPVIKSNTNVISIKDGDRMKTNSWTLAPDVKPDIYEADLMGNKPQKVTFITDVDSITFTVEVGKTYDFIIKHGPDRCFTRIIGRKYIPAAVFNKAYQSSHRNRTFVEAPEVYELINVALAMTKTGIKDKNLIYQKSDYYKAVRKWFDKFADHPLLASLDNELRENYNRYFTLKMNGYAFEFNPRGKIVRSKIYERTGFTSERSNALEPYIQEMQSFADETRFRDFYRANKKTYNDQIEFFRTTANIAEMKRWLDKNFPSSNDYNTYKIIFSPLVAYNQSTTWFESNGFKELQPHVNFPYAEDLTRYAAEYKMSAESQIIFRGNIVFTEINHGYINPEADKYTDKIIKAISNRWYWVDPKKGDSYYGGISSFNEYMNWALVCLRITDYARKEDQAAMISAVEEMMIKRRGFPRFAELDKFLIPLYKNRARGATLADLYPQIIDWFAEKNKASLLGARAARPH